MAVAAANACLAARAAFVVPGGRPRGLPVGVRRGVGEAGAMCGNALKTKMLEILLGQLRNGIRSCRLMF